MNVIEQLRRFFSPEPPSREVAKERLKLVLVHDRLSLSPALMQTLKDELIAVISKYVAIDPAGVEVTLSQSRYDQRLVADIPLAPLPLPPPDDPAAPTAPGSQDRAADPGRPVRSTGKPPDGARLA
ncbi:MAG: cell division topological specificity factor MinE [Dehalococcoidia bacterium]|nr:cell division topological specificity factor MinE [Dehalococcoidia bacterium]